MFYCLFLVHNSIEMFHNLPVALAIISSISIVVLSSVGVHPTRIVGTSPGTAARTVSAIAAVATSTAIVGCWLRG